MKLKTLGIYIGLIPTESPPPLRPPWLVWAGFLLGALAAAAVFLILDHLLFN